MSDWPFTGRAAEAAAISEMLLNGRAGVMIAGAAGIGKTRLALETGIVMSRRGWHVREIAGTHPSRAVPLGAFQQWSRAATDPLRVVRDMVESITERDDDRPILVIADDVHQLDEISAFTLSQLVLRKAARVIATVRTDLEQPTAITALWKDRHLARLDLTPLSRNESDELLSGVLGAPISTDSGGRIWRHTRGNILFLRELVESERAANRFVHSGGQWQWLSTLYNAESLPESLVQVVGQQLASLDDDVAAAIGFTSLAEPLDLTVLEQMANRDAIEEAERRGLISVTGDNDRQVRVGHPIYGEVQQSLTSPEKLKQLRSQLIKAMLDRATETRPADPIRLALLWQGSDLPPDRDVFTTAAWAAIQRLDLELTERFADLACQAGAGVPMQFLRAQTLLLLSSGASANAVLDAIDTDALPESMQAALLHLRATNFQWILAEPTRSWQIIDDALGRESGMVKLAAQAFRSVQLVTSAARPLEALALAESIDRAAAPPMSAMIVIWASTIAAGDLGRPELARKRAREGKILGTKSPEIVYQTVNLECFHVEALALNGLADQARVVADEVAQRQADMPDITRSVAAAIGGMAAFYAGDLRAAQDRLSSALADFGAHISRDGRSYHDDGMSYQFTIYHTATLAMSGRLEAAGEALTLMRRCRRDGWVHLDSANLLAQAWVAAAAQDLDAARELVGHAAEFAEQHHQYAREVLCLQTAIQFGQISPQLCSRLNQLADVVAGPRASLVARWANATAENDGDEILRVSAEFEAGGDLIAAADAAAQASSVFVENARVAAALSAATRAFGLYAHCSAHTPASQLMKKPVSLTSRESEIAAFIATGMTNKQISNTLTVSTRTVEGHVYRICRKLGLSSRAEIGRVIGEMEQSG